MIYVVSVKPSAEIEVCAKLKNSGINAFAPMRNVLERNKGKWHEVARIVFSSYVFIDIDLTDEIYYKVKNTNGVLRFLGKPPEPIRQTEIEHLCWIFEMQNIGISKGEMKNDRLVITEGALVGKEHIVTDYNPRTMRGWIHTKINGKDHKFSVTIDTR
ncbi:MAG: transcription termination/antitermination NusG family protein [Oscillospiraceae bacterium]